MTGYIVQITSWTSIDEGETEYYLVNQEVLAAIKDSLANGDELGAVSLVREHGMPIQADVVLEDVHY